MGCLSRDEGEGMRLALLTGWLLFVVMRRESQGTEQTDGTDYDGCAGCCSGLAGWLRWSSGRGRTGEAGGQGRSGCLEMDFPLQTLPTATLSSSARACPAG